MTRFSNALALALRTICILALLLLVVHKLWPGEMLATPLSQLTLGQIFFGLIQVGVGIGIGAVLVVALVSVPGKDKRTFAWRERWISIPITVAFFIALPFLLQAGDHQPKGKIASAIVEFVGAVVGWLIS